MLSSTISVNQKIPKVAKVNLDVLGITQPPAAHTLRSQLNTELVDSYLENLLQGVDNFGANTIARNQCAGRPLGAFDWCLLEDIT